MKPARKTKARRPAARRSPPLSLSARIERLEKAVLFPPTVAKTTARAATRFTKRGEHGTPTVGPHVAVFDAKTGLTWSAGPLLGGKDLTHAESMDACAALDLLGQKDWRAPTIEELISIIDYSRANPAVDTDVFAGPYGWTWSSTPASAPAGYVWDVYLNNGYSNHVHRDNHYRVRAVRAGQPLGLVVNIPNMTDAQLEELKRNCAAAIAAGGDDAKD